MADNFQACERALRDGRLDDLRELNEMHRGVDNQPRRSLYASYYETGPKAVEAVFDALITDPTFIRAARRLRDLVEVSEAEATQLAKGFVPERLIPERLRVEFGPPLVWRSLPNEPEIMLPEPIGRMHETFATPPRTVIYPQPLQAAMIENGSLYWDGRQFQAFSGDTPLTMPDSSASPSLVVAAAARTRENASRVVRSDGDVHVFGSPGPRSFYHWMLDIVPLLAASRALFPEVACRTIVSNGTGLGFQHASLRLVEPEAEILDLQGPIIVEAPRIVIARHVNGLGQALPQWIIEFWRSLRQPDPAREWPRLIYVRRKGQSGRTLLPVDDVEALMVERDFTLVVMEEHPLPDQFEMFATADVVVSAHGAGLAHAMFMRPGSALVEVYGDHMTDSFRFLAGRGGVHYLPVAMPGRFKDVNARTVEQRDETRFADVHVDLARLSLAVDIALSVHV